MLISELCSLKFLSYSTASTSVLSLPFSNAAAAWENSTVTGTRKRRRRNPSAVSKKQTRTLCCHFALETRQPQHGHGHDRAPSQLRVLRRSHRTRSLTRGPRPQVGRLTKQRGLCRPHATCDRHQFHSGPLKACTRRTRTSSRRRSSQVNMASMTRGGSTSMSWMRTMKRCGAQQHRSWPDRLHPRRSGQETHTPASHSHTHRLAAVRGGSLTRLLYSLTPPVLESSARQETQAVEPTHPGLFLQPNHVIHPFHKHRTLHPSSLIFFLFKRAKTCRAIQPHMQTRDVAKRHFVWV